MPTVDVALEECECDSRDLSDELEIDLGAHL
jgi:hypothetical protein